MENFSDSENIAIKVLKEMLPNYEISAININYKISQGEEYQLKLELTSWGEKQGSVLFRGNNLEKVTDKNDGNFSKKFFKKYPLESNHLQ